MTRKLHQRTRSDGPLLDTRAALILALATIVGIAAGWLTIAAHRSAPEGIIAAGSAFAATLTLLNKIIE